MTDKTELIAELKQRVAKLPPLEDEPDFITSDETIVRFLKSRDWHVDAAEKMLIDSVEYRRTTRPQTLDCAWCHNRPGFHSMRQVGHDEAGRPVIYANFAQASTIKNTAEDSVTHVTYLIENAKRTMGIGVSTWVFVIDCTGMTLSSCNPKLGYGVTNVLSNHYPERLGLVICINHNPVFHGVWKAMKKFLHPHTAAKVRMARSKSKIADLFSQLFNPELSAWLQAEIDLNKQKPLRKSQLEFWNPPPKGDAHDPRGCPSYVREHIDTFIGKAGRLSTPKATPKKCKATPLEGQTKPSNGTPANAVQPALLATPLANETTPTRRVFAHRPHPNIVDQLSGRQVAAVDLTKEELEERFKAQKMMEEGEGGGGGASDGEEEGAADVDIPSELQIPASAVQLAATS